MRVFKTASFARAVRKALISDVALCDAAREAAAGQADDLGGGVFKKRLNRNLHRSIIHATIYAALTENQLRDGVAAGQLKEICRDQE